MFESNGNDESNGSPLNKGMLEQENSPLHTCDLIPTNEDKITSPNFKNDYSDEVVFLEEINTENGHVESDLVLKDTLFE